MPEQTSHRGDLVTRAAFTGPFETAIWPFGVGGLDLTSALDQIAVGDYSRLTNLCHNQDRELRQRPGQYQYLDAEPGSEHHSIRRLNDPANDTWTYVVGVDNKIFTGQSGTLTQVDTGYSGGPLTLLPYRPPQSGEPWMFVGNSARMRKIRSDGLVLPIGLPAPTAAVAAVAQAEQQTSIANFLDDGTQAAGTWSCNTGQTFDETPTSTGVPTVGPVVNSVDGSWGVHFLTNPTHAVEPNGYNSSWGIARVLDLSVVGGATAEDEDLIHLWLNFSHTQFIREFRVYFVCSPSFRADIIPGVSIYAVGNVNSDAYVKAFTGADLAYYVQGQQTQTDAAEQARVRAIRDAGIAGSRTRAGTEERSHQAALRAAYDYEHSIAQTIPPGNDSWAELGIVGVPLRKSDFQRIGTDQRYDWSTITGLFFLVVCGPGSGPVDVRISSLYLVGGAGPDTSEAGSQQYDYRYTNYDPRTGCESNPSPEFADTAKIDVRRTAIDLTPPAASDTDLVQRFYRRGGSLYDDWYYVGQNLTNGAVLVDDLSDDAIVAAGTLEIDHYEPVCTVDADGVTVEGQAVPVIFGPYDGRIFGLGDPYRPGHLYWCLPDQPDHWPATNCAEVCSPSEELMTGVMYAGQPWVFSRERLYGVYPGLTDAESVKTAPSGCARGIISRWAVAVGVGGIYFVSRDGVFRTTGGPEQKLSEKIAPIFRGDSRYGYSAINFTVESALRLEIHQDRLWFLYEDLNGSRQVLIYSLIDQTWRHYLFAQPLACVYADEALQTQQLLLGSYLAGRTYLHAGTSDDGVAIPCVARTGAWDLGKPREDKLLGDQILDADMQNVSGTLQNFLNAETVTNDVEVIGAFTGRRRIVFDGFGTKPQKARTISTEIRWSALGASPILYFLGLSTTDQPEMTVNRVTNWDDLGSPDESYVTGITLDCDTAGLDRTTVFERDFGGVVSTIATVTVNCSGRHKVKFSWPAVPAHQVRIRPDQYCTPWILYRADWIALPEPPRIAGWDLHYEADGDVYYTGLDLYCDTENLTKQIEISVDGTVLADPATALAYWSVQANGRRWIHLTLPWGRGHVFHVRALDTNPGLLYKHRWHVEAEPSEQHNWNQNFSVLGTRADKYLKALLFECDTNGVNKSVAIEADGAVVETLTVNADGRKVVQVALTTQHLGRVWRVWPTDHQPGRLYSLQPVFDEEPFCLTRWETQELDHDQPGFQALLAGQFTLKSTKPVVVTLTITRNQGSLRQPAETVTQTYTIPATRGVKEKRYVPFQAEKGVLFKYVFTSEAAFYLYKEESSVVVQPWGAERALEVRPFGNSDVDRTREMVIASLAAAKSGGGSA